MKKTLKTNIPLASEVKGWLRYHALILLFLVKVGIPLPPYLRDFLLVAQLTI